MDNYIGEIRIFAGTYAPQGWFLCNGQLLSISQYQTLFALIGTTYGGDGVSTFALPDLRGRIPINQGQGLGLSNYPLGATAGTENVTLIGSNVAHTHSAIVSTSNGSTPTPGPGVMAASLGTTGAAYVSGSVSGVAPAALNSNALQNTGGSLPHNNMMPTLTVNFIIASVGIFPSQN